MIDSKHRFQGYGSLRFVFSKGNTVRGQFFSLREIENKRRDTYRVAVVVSRKVHKSAVVRNRIRRRIYEQLRLALADVTKSYDIAVIAYSDKLAELPSAELQAELTDKLKQAEIL